MKNKIDFLNIDNELLGDAFKALRREVLEDIKYFRNRVQHMELGDIVKESEHLKLKLEEVEKVIKDNFPDPVFNSDDIPF